MKNFLDKQFNHLKIHTQYSICEGALKISNFAMHCKENKIQSAAITDSNNCIYTDNITITSPNPISVIETITNVSCNAGNDGSISATIIGGNNPFTYLWDDPQQQTTNSINRMLIT